MLNKPEVFIGNRAKFKTWFWKVGLYIRDCEKELQTDEQKINFLFSYIQGDAVDSWVENYYDQHYKEINIDREDNPWLVDYLKVWEDLSERFTDANLKWAAQVKIDSLTQGSDTAEDFFQKFKVLLTQAGYTWDNEYVVTLLEKNVNDRIIDQIYSGTDLPADYKTWKYAIMKLDAMWRHRNQIRKWGGYTPRPQTQQQTTPLPAR